MGNIESPAKHTHEEADTLIIWHCLHASNESTDRNHKIIVYSSDTDVACLLVHFEDQFLAKVYMITQRKVYLDISSISASLSISAKALISIHSLPGCDTTDSIQIEILIVGTLVYVYEECCSM